MIERAVRQSRKDRQGDIVALGDAGATWSPRPATSIIADIESGMYRYYVPWRTGRTEVRVVMGARGKYLRTDRDNTSRNNLDELPSC